MKTEFLDPVSKRLPSKAWPSLSVKARWLHAFPYDTFYRVLFACFLYVHLYSCQSFYEKEAQELTQGKQQKVASTRRGREKKDAGVVVNRGIYRVGTQIITQEDLERTSQRLRRMKTKGNVKKKAIDTLIERTLVAEVAEQESIVISDKRIKNEIVRQSQFQGLSEAQFRKKIEKELNLPFQDWSEELRYRLIKKQLAQIHLRITPPSDGEIKSFYRKNRKRIGLEFRYREMVFIPQNASIAEEKRISAITRDIAARLQSDPKSFTKMAKTNPHNHSRYKYRGGLRSYQSIHEIAAKNRVLAMVLYNHRRDQISRPFRDSLNRYMIVKVEKRRAIPLEKVRHFILAQLYRQREDLAFQKWIKEKKQKVTIIALEKKS